VLTDVAPTRLLVVPAGHTVQRGFAGSVSVPAYVFAGHRHASMLPAPVPVLLESRGHVTHACMLVAPDAVLNVFTGQAVHPACIENAPNVPRGHGVHTPFPTPSAYVPVGHGSHAE
jgi:hypothetical protein